MSNIAKRPNGKWRARVVLPDGRTQRARHFDRNVDAKGWVAQQVVRLADSTWVDPLHGRRTFESYARAWFELQAQFRPSTAQRVKSLLEHHLIPRFGDQALVAIQRSDVQAWVKSLTGCGSCRR